MRNGIITKSPHNIKKSGGVGKCMQPRIDDKLAIKLIAILQRYIFLNRSEHRTQNKNAEIWNQKGHVFISGLILQLCKIEKVVERKPGI